MVVYSQIEQCTALCLGSTCYLILRASTEPHELRYLAGNHTFDDGADHEALQLASCLLTSLKDQENEPYQGEDL